MLPKITMQAPSQIDGGQIHASGSGKNYDLDARGRVTIDAVDAKDLLGLGFVQIHGDGGDEDAKHITTSVSTTSATQGAQALDPDARQAGRRTKTVGPSGGGNTGDFGNATPPHGLPSADVHDPKLKADAQNEALTQAATGMDPSKPSAQAETGAPNQQAAPAAARAKAGEDAKG